VWVVNISLIEPRIDQTHTNLLMLDDTHVDWNLDNLIFDILGFFMIQIHDA
jgi:hypothetical protein